MLFSVAQFTRASCDLHITSAGPCLADGTYATPTIGDQYYSVKVSFKVTGTPTNPFRIKFTIANTTRYSGYLTLHDGWNWDTWLSWTLPLDDSIPWSVTLDPDGVSGNSNLVNSSTNGIFTPIPPSSDVELYSPRLMHGYESIYIDFQPQSGSIPYFYEFFGMPTTHGAQTAITVSPPNGQPGQTVLTQPYGVPVFQIVRTNVSASIFQDTNAFIMRLSRIRVNPALLRTNTWSAMNSLGTNWTQWIADQGSGSTNPLVASFVQQSLPKNYLTTLTPYDTARTLHRAVMKALTYQSSHPAEDAVGALQNGVADCGGFAGLLTACLRNVGIPARTVAGFFQGDSIWHVRVEFHLPSVEWLVADPCDGNAFDASGTYAYYFGYIPNADTFLAVDTGTVHVTKTPLGTIGAFQEPAWFWLGGNASWHQNYASYLQPNGVLCVTNSPTGLFQFYLNDPPNEGSVVLQTSTNLNDWSPIATNSVNGNAINYSFPATDGVRRYYRENVIP